MPIYPCYRPIYNKAGADYLSINHFPTGCHLQRRYLSNMASKVPRLNPGLMARLWSRPTSTQSSRVSASSTKALHQTVRTSTRTLWSPHSRPTIYSSPTSPVVIPFPSAFGIRTIFIQTENTPNADVGLLHVQRFPMLTTRGTQISTQSSNPPQHSLIIICGVPISTINISPSPSIATCRATFEH